MNLLGRASIRRSRRCSCSASPIPSCFGRIAETLRALGVERALVVHGSGLDEVALHGFTQAVRLAGGELEELEITPEEAGLGACRWIRSPAALRRRMRARLRALLDGRGGEADETIVALNAGALLMTAGKAADLRLGTVMALGRVALRQRGRGARPLHRGEPWLSRSGFSAGSPPAKRDELARPLRRRFARRLAGKRTATSRSLVDALRKAGRAVHP